MLIDEITAEQKKVKLSREIEAATLSNTNSTSLVASTPLKERKTRKQRLQ